MSTQSDQNGTCCQVRKQSKTLSANYADEPALWEVGKGKWSISNWQKANRGKYQDPASPFGQRRNKR